MSKKLNVFISYAHEDKEYKENIDKHLFSLKRSEAINTWTDTELIPGTPWDDTIRNKLQNSDIIIFLISVDFETSNYINDVEIKIAFERYDKGLTTIVPIICRDCDWTSSQYAKFQALPRGAEPIANAANKDIVYTEIAIEIRRLVNFLSKK